VPHGLANAALISHVIAYNATDAPFKQATFSQYHFPNVKAAYADLADFLGFSQPGDDEERKVIRLIEAIEGALHACSAAAARPCAYSRHLTRRRMCVWRAAGLKKELDIPATIKEIVGAAKETEYMAALDTLAENAFDDQVRSSAGVVCGPPGARV
jgi:acetaldehyde dehydrogenase/alcohol dehydrogenase